MAAINARQPEPLPEKEVRDICKHVGQFPAGKSSGRRLVAIASADVVATKGRFLWDARIPLGSVTFLVGVQGTGKSTLLTRVAGRGSVGKLRGDFYGKPFTTLMVSYEDDRSRVLSRACSPPDTTPPAFYFSRSGSPTTSKGLSWSRKTYRASGTLCGNTAQSSW